MRLLDTYVSKLALKVAALTFIGLLGIFYISTFIDLSDKLFKGQTTAAMLAEFFYYKTPEFIFFIIPLTVLIGVMVTIGILTKNSELVVMQACGISLYRVAVPMVLLAMGASGAMFLLQDRVLPYSNRRAQALRHVIRGGTPRTFDVINRKWLVARDGSIYNYTFYDQRRHELNGLSIYEFDPARGDLVRRVYVGRAGFQAASRQTWKSSNGWVREFTKGTDLKAFVTFPARDLTLEAPEYFATESEEPDRMTYGQLKRYIADLLGQRRQRRASDRGAVPQGLVPVRDADHDAHRGALCRDHRQARRAVRHRGRHCPRGRVLDDQQRVQRSRYSWNDARDARRVGAQPDLRGGRRLSAADRADVSRHFSRPSACTSDTHTSPAEPGVVLTVSTTIRMASIVSTLGAAAATASAGVNSRSATLCSAGACDT